MDDALHHIPEAAGGIPAHVAIIMDGNGRWAAARGLPRSRGHRKGADSVKTAVKSAMELGVRYLTLYGFSSENWKRPVEEVRDLMGLLRIYLRSEVAELRQNDIRVRFIGERGVLSPDIVNLIEDCEASTAHNSGLVLTVALSYGARAEIATAARHIAIEVRDGKLDPARIDEGLFSTYLETAGIPDPDLLIRTSGEKRISNFLLWQSAYSEFVFVDTLWPDFGRAEFFDAVAEYQRRDRRYGMTGVRNHG
jgi:undecaprenyl diphosphate synthase